ncbi:hypothetical protein F441_14732 [Phytophthora nicotianae CJ01A1]|uniref:Uncharacterized protein n=3 Tax=Phytophthora nicotianae TaxID=4792 RepID=W2YRI7_PHYNI|nr:hypothetical protein L914_14322 [Phytophthora nicotianae]ETP09404.1 hypothetical protein F441_14732 [Phytophthora nicotianae CJ01A1]ETP37447.1 hypothetical protein F442_14748 [Phytophthora nicotianae P10297]
MRALVIRSAIDPAMAVALFVVSMNDEVLSVPNTEKM